MKPFGIVYHLINDGEFVYINNLFHHYLVPRRVFGNTNIELRSTVRKFQKYEISSFLADALNL